MATRTNNNRTYYINPAYLTFNENSGYGANLIQVSASSSCWISVYDKANGIGYSDADKNYQRWKVTAYNNKFPDNDYDAYRIYVRLERNGTSALIVYSKKVYNVDGSSADTEASADYYYIYIGDVSATDGTSIRSITYDTGYLESDQGYEDANELTEMWELDKYTTPWLIKAKQWLADFTVKGFVSLIGGLIFKNGEEEKKITDIKRSTDNDEDVPVSDESLPTTKYISNIIEDLDDRFLRKDQDDRSAGVIASDKGFEAGNFETGATGAACYQDKDGNWHIETDHLKVRKKAEFTEVDIQTTYHVGGQQMSTAASMRVDYVLEMEDAYRCYFLKKDSDGREVWNQWRLKDQAYCNTFNLSKQQDGSLGNHYLWRLVTATSNETKDNASTRVFGDVTIQTSDYHFVDLSKSICAENSDAPYPSDEIVLLGHQGNDSSRQGCIIVAGAGEGSPYIYEFTGVGTIPFYLPEPETKIKPGDNQFSGVMRIQGGSVGAENLKDLPEEIYKSVKVGGVNLLRNSGFTGDYQTELLEEKEVLDTELEMYSKNFIYWKGKAKVNEGDEDAVSGCTVEIGELSQEVKELKAKESYVISFKAKGKNVIVSCGNFLQEVPLKAGYERYIIKFDFAGSNLFKVSGDATLCDLKLEWGTIPTDWNTSPYDNDKAYEEIQSINYISAAIKEGITTTIKGLILSSIVQLGNYKNGVMQKVNAGMSGIYSDDNDVAFWAGGTMEEAIRTIVKFKDNPRYRPTAEEWKRMANFAVSHGGDIFLRGYIYALGGYFRGAVEIANGKIMLNQDGSGHLANKGIRWEKNGLMYRKATDVIEWFMVYTGERKIDFDKGSYFDLSYPIYGIRQVFELPDAPANGYRICVSLKELLGFSSVTLKGKFHVHDPENPQYGSQDYLSIHWISPLEFWLTFNTSNRHWTVETTSYKIKEYEDGTKEVVLGLNSSIVVGDNEESRTVIEEEKIKVQKLEINDTSEESIKTKGGVKVAKEILIGESKDTDTLLSKDKVKTKSTEILNEMLVGSNKESDTYLTPKKVKTTEIEATEGIRAKTLSLSGSLGKSLFLASPSNESGAPVFRGLVDDDISGMKNLKTGVSTLKSDVSVLKGDVGTLGTSVSALQTSTSTLRTDVNGMSTELNTLKESVNKIVTSIEDIEKRLETLEDTSGDTGTE